MIEDFFKEQKELISKELEGFFGGEGKKLAGVPWGKEVCSRLLRFALGGKMIRGGLVLLAHEVFGGKKKSEAVKAAAAIELLQSGLLIHDDIIDRDLVRRGEKSIFAEYGQNLGVCIGDAGYFFAYKILPKELLEIFSKKSVEVALGQMQDIYLGTSKKNVSEKEVLDVYLYKTASYSCSLPLMMGAILSGKSDEVVKRMEDLGKYLGIIFQIKDDEMGLFGKEEQIGKSVGGDIKEAKKTLYYLHLFKRAKGEELRKLKSVFGNENITKKDVLFVQELVKKLEVDVEINKKLAWYEKKARGLIGQEKILLELLEFSLKRKK